LGLIWMLWVIYIVSTRKFNLYYWNTLLGACGIIGVVGLSLYQGVMILSVIIITALLSFVFILAGVYLPKVLTPGYKEVKEPYVNSEGENRMMVKHIFQE